jgi:hypothetical protein
MNGNGDSLAQAIKVLIDRVDAFLSRKDTIPQAAKDELILDVMKMTLLILIEHSSRLRFLEKYKPYLQVLAFASGIAAAALITMFISGKFIVTLR